MNLTEFDSGKNTAQPVEKPVETVNNRLHMFKLSTVMETDYCKPNENFPTFCRKIGGTLDRRCGEVVLCFREKGGLIVLIVAKSLRDLSFGALMHLYEEDNLIRGRRYWPDESEPRQMALAEADAYGGLQEFFRQPGGTQYIWQDGGRYVAALRLEPYRDGLLLTGLSTDPADRGKGHATALLRAVLSERGNTRIYSHIFHDNAPSIHVHKKCGFLKISDTASFLEGTVSVSAGTYVYNGNE